MARVLTILCSSSSLKDDIIRCGVVGDVMAVNRVIMDYKDRLHYAVCIHQDLLGLYLKYREMIKLNHEDVKKHTCFFDWPLSINSSGLLALCVASTLGYDEIRVLGMSADNSGHYYNLPTTGCCNFEERFPFDNPDWQPIFKSWTNVKVASGNLLRLFHKL